MTCPTCHRAPCRPGCRGAINPRRSRAGTPTQPGRINIVAWAASGGAAQRDDLPPLSPTRGEAMRAEEREREMVRRRVEEVRRS